MNKTITKKSSRKPKNIEDTEHSASGNGWDKPQEVWGIVWNSCILPELFMNKGNAKESMTYQKKVGFKSLKLRKFRLIPLD